MTVWVVMCDPGYGDPVCVQGVYDSLERAIANAQHESDIEEFTINGDAHGNGVPT